MFKITWSCGISKLVLSVWVIEVFPLDELLEKALILIKRKKRLADFIKERETTWRLTDPQKGPTHCASRPTFCASDFLSAHPLLPLILSSFSPLQRKS